ncbi:MAG TPA: 2-oxoacid:acceptor oxidoreductase subunit alpha [Candidatus Marinimicrobia bacterium]|nr:2-oxoacid:acceptor oxidoreductase subunit alpha [Candidatus Neomarinimicrobiota bacterium]
MGQKDIAIGIAGSGGDGVISAGEILINASASDGLFTFMLKSFGPQIRGGESSVRVRLNQNPIATQGDRLDVLVVLSWKDFMRFRTEFLFKKDLVIVSDSEDKFPEKDIPIDREMIKAWYQVPFASIAKEASGTSLAKNIVMLGVISELFKLPQDALRRSVMKKFSHKSNEVIESNVKAITAGQEYVQVNLKKEDHVLFEYEPSHPKLVMEGNEAVAFGAIYSGLKYFAGYPITPSGEIMEFLGKFLPKYGGVMMQMEDELASINAVVGASFVGAKAMTATSGPGISLMNESIGLASMAELPIVVVNVQRVGPSTGIPTKTEQADLMQAIWGSHGDSPRVVIAPSDVEDCFDTTVLSFYIAEKYQIPVILLSDSFIGQRKESINPDRFRNMEYGFKKVNTRLTPTKEELENFKRYRLTESGISAVSFPGIKGGEYQAAGIEHDEKGWPTSDVDIHNAMNRKRFRKHDLIKKEFEFVRFYGPDDAEIGIVGWGSSKGAIKEAVERANAEGIKVGAIIPQIILPFLTGPFEKFVSNKKKVIMAEVAFSGPFRRYLRGFIRFGDYGASTIPFRISGGAPFTVEQIYDKIVEVSKMEDKK